MAELLIAPKSAPASTQVSARDNESRTKEAARDNADGGVPFASVLKSASEKGRPEADRPNSSEGQPPAPDAAATAAAPAPAEQAAAPAPAEAAIDPAALLSLLTTGQSVGPGATPAEPTPDALPADAAPIDLLMPPAAAGAVNTASTVSPAPTFAGAGTMAATGGKGAMGAMGAMGAANRHAESGAPNPADFAGEGRSTGEKLAADAALSAASTAPGIASTRREPVEGEFRAVIDRAMNGPSNVPLQSGAATPATTASGLRVDTPLGQPGWHDEMGQKLTWMVNNHRQQADLVLNPPQLGRIEVTLTLNGDQASVSFVSPHAAVRETLENSMARLREVLADAGVSLGQSHVGAESRNNPDSAHWKGNGLTAGRAEGEPQFGMPGALNNGSAGRSAVGRGMVDIFA